MNIEIEGKAYANRKPEAERPASDFYETPRSLTEKLLEVFPIHRVAPEIGILEPADWNGAISDVLIENGCRNVISRDLMTGDDFLEGPIERFPVIITNPPFSRFDAFVTRAKQTADRFAFIGKTNFFGAYRREKAGIWEHLREVHVFNRQVDYQGPIYEDGSFHVGCLVTGWFIWDMSWERDYWETRILDVNKFATKGPFKKRESVK